MILILRLRHLKYLHSEEEGELEESEPNEIGVQVKGGS